MSDYLSFHLGEDFLEAYKTRTPDWGFPIGAGNSLAEMTFVTKYSRLKEDGTKERWWEVCRRCIEGYYSILKDHCHANKTPWNEWKAQKAARDAYERMFTFKWMPPGRGLWMMGTEFVNGRGNSAALQNCSFVSTEKLSTHSAEAATLPFVRLMEMSMLGVGVGFDTRGADRLTIHMPKGDPEVWQIPDTREGWCDSVQMKLESFFFKNRRPVQFDYSLIRPAGEPIKGFGGTAAGPQPLMDLHDKLDELYATEERDGTTLSTLDITDICNLIAKCVVSGNVRRSALIALGQPDDDVFLNLKNYEAYPERNGMDGWAWSSNNSVFADVDGDYASIAERIGDNGEPGLIFLDMAREYGRLVDPPDGKDLRVLGCNPCVTGDTWVTTADGPRQVIDLINNPVPMLVDGKSYNVESNGFFYTGTKPVWRLVTDEGWTVRLTEDHQVLLQDGRWVEAGALSPGDEIRRHMHIGNKWGDGSFEEGYVSGLYVGDGSMMSGGPTLCTWGTTRGVEAVREFVHEYVDSLGHRSDWVGWRQVPGRDEMRLRSVALREVLARHGLGSSKGVTEQILAAGSDTYRGFLSGLFDADGHVEGASHGGGISIRLSQSDLGLLESVQRMLSAFGISSKIRKLHEGGPREMPDGRGGAKVYDTKPSWRLIISGQDCSLFMTTVGFKDSDKRDKFYAEEAKMTRGFYSKPPVATFVRLEYDGEEPVFDVTVEDVHAFDANGLYVHNCAEQPLEHMEMCTLVETFPFHHDSIEDFQQTLKHAYLYGKAVTLLPTHWPETNEVMQRNRRIGCSVSGLAQFVEGHSWTELRQWLDAGFKAVQERDRKYSEWLGVRESIRTTTVKPSGTVSLVAGATPGVHWPVAAGNYWRRMRFSNVDPLLEVVRQAGYHVEPDVMNPKTTSVATFPTQGPRCRDEREVSLWEKAELAVMLQRWWSNNMVSCTLTFREDEKEQIPALMSAKAGQLKTMSMLPLLPQGAYAQMPYEAMEGEPDWDGYLPIDWEPVYNSGTDAEGEKFCTTDVCEVKI